LPRARRIARRSEFLAVEKLGRRLGSTHYLLFVRRNPTGAARIGVTVSRKVGNAVTRNQVKRWIREAYRRMGDELPRAADVVVVARPQAGEAGFAAARAEIGTLLRKAVGR
jgi:ribonuclease P protein component